MRLASAAPCKAPPARGGPKSECWGENRSAVALPTSPFGTGHLPHRGGVRGARVDRAAVRTRPYAGLYPIGLAGRELKWEDVMATLCKTYSPKLKAETGREI